MERDNFFWKIGNEKAKSIAQTKQEKIDKQEKQKQSEKVPIIQKYWKKYSSKKKFIQDLILGTEKKLHDLETVSAVMEKKTPNSLSQ